MLKNSYQTIFTPKEGIAVAYKRKIHFWCVFFFCFKTDMIEIYLSYSLWRSVRPFIMYSYLTCTVSCHEFHLYPFNFKTIREPLYFVLDEAILAWSQLHEGGCGRKWHHPLQRSGYPCLLPVRDYSRRTYQHIQGKIFSFVSILNQDAVSYLHSYTYVQQTNAV